jgi:hypothetical protein
MQRAIAMQVTLHGVLPEARARRGGAAPGRGAVLLAEAGRPDLVGALGESADEEAGPVDGL